MIKIISEMGENALSKFEIFEHIINTKFITKGTCLTLINGLISTLDKVTGNIDVCENNESLYKLIQHSIGNRYLTETESDSIISEISSGVSSIFTNSIFSDEK